jgi:hypothetical protein
MVDSAAALEFLGRRDEGIAVLEQASALATAGHISPNDRARTFTALANLLSGAGRIERAKELAEMVLAGPADLDPELRGVAQAILGS